LKTLQPLVIKLRKFMLRINM